MELISINSQGNTFFVLYDFCLYVTNEKGLLPFGTLLARFHGYVSEGSLVPAVVRTGCLCSRLICLDEAFDISSL